MTKQLFLENSYLREFHGRIIEQTPKGVVLDRTAFYPESGGQLGDKGTLEIKNKVIDVTNTRLDKRKIIHEISEEIPMGIEVKGKIDWDFRYKLMRTHSAQHIISRWFQLNFGAETVSTQLKYEKSRLDLQPIGKLSSNQLENIASKINEFLSKNLDISVTLRPREEAIEFLKEKKYQIKYLEMIPKFVRDFRIVTIGDYDFAACAGTHVQNTSEIGSVSFLRTKNKGKKRERLFYNVNT
ncbi:MAG: alanyl-tRNA editing protein [Candidatus Heimdallarchaeota archaeon]|nr:alanyl-tRNA editing protein [Candidatus Heimdallarchaeota archaeon]